MEEVLKRITPRLNLHMLGDDETMSQLIKIEKSPWSNWLDKMISSMLNVRFMPKGHACRSRLHGNLGVRG